MASAYRIILMGKTGTGKSATGNTLLGRPAFHSTKGGSSVTDACVMARAESDSLHSCVVDTPGLFDTKCVAKRALDIQEAVKMCSNPHAFLLVLNASTRVTPEDGVTVDMLQMIFGPSVLEHTVVVFTHGQEFKSDESFEDFWNDTPELANIVERCGSRVCRVENSELLMKENFSEHPLYKMISDVSRNGTEAYNYEFTEQHTSAFKEYIDTFRGNMKAIEQIRCVNEAIETFVREAQIKHKSQEADFNKELKKEDEALRQQKLEWEKSKQVALEKLKEDIRKSEAERQSLEDGIKDEYRKFEERMLEEERLFQEEKKRWKEQRLIEEKRREEDWQQQQEDAASQREEWHRSMEEKIARWEEECSRREQAMHDESKRKHEELNARQEEMQREAERKAEELRMQIDVLMGKQPPQGGCLGTSLDPLLMAAGAAALQTPYAPYVIPVIGAVAAVKQMSKK